MKKRNSLALIAFATIVLSSCDQDEQHQTVGTWDGTDYNTGKDTIINQHSYHYSSYGYWYWYNSGQVTRYYPRTGYSQTLSADEHRSGAFLSSSAHTGNGGAGEDPAHFSSGHGGTVEGFGRTAHGVPSGEGFGGSAHAGGEGGGE
ncbi:hypothetical protein G7092_19275 [Mucilaginibacter sp. HC2]|uniref:hypothetical protein n=1 Tax=Mucilaginibacter inviolabilis TaxID=2714892 RepID=UPI00140DC73D|nr:hypothetical protein [Mucilaginibacter inviolabilis]NHA05961.1 hypothetical protein [Mucilaginibacter inviolabilis]